MSQSVIRDRGHHEEDGQNHEYEARNSHRPKEVTKARNVAGGQHAELFFYVPENHIFCSRRRRRSMKLFSFLLFT